MPHPSESLAGHDLSQLPFHAERPLKGHISILLISNQPSQMKQFVDTRLPTTNLFTHLPSRYLPLTIHDNQNAKLNKLHSYSLSVEQTAGSNLLYLYELSCTR